VDLSYPIRSVVPSLDGPVLVVLAGTTRPLTVFDVQRLARIGSPSGIRKVLERLAGEGLISVDRRANAAYYVANREHLAWPAVETLVSLRQAMLSALTTRINAFVIRPLHASLFGSAARGEGDAGSDIDVLLIAPSLTSETEVPWESQLDTLRSGIFTVTGNRCQTFDISLERLREYLDARDPLVDSWTSDGILLAGDPFDHTVERARTMTS